MSRTAFVTGGTRGIGKALALQLADEGASLALNYMSRSEDAEQTVAEIEARGARAVAIAGDVSALVNDVDLITLRGEFTADHRAGEPRTNKKNALHYRPPMPSRQPFISSLIMGNPG